MSNYLCVDTSSRYLTVIAAHGDKVALRHVPDCALNHSVVLMDEIDAALEEARLCPSECDYFAAVTGPGSFTGIRIGISAVKGFAVALDAKCLGVTSFDMLSYNVNSDCSYAVAIDAAHGHFYVCGYTADGECDISPCYLSEEELVGLGRPVYGFEELELPSYTMLDAAQCLLKISADPQAMRGGLAALYVRRSQAEEERARRLRGL